MRTLLATATLIALGSSGVCLADGDLDTSFGLFNSGKSIVIFDEGNPPYDHLVDVMKDADGRIYLVGQVEDADGIRQIGVARMLPDGSLDTSFGIGGKRTTTGTTSRYASAAALRANGDILVANRFVSSGDSQYSVCLLDGDTGVTKLFDGVAAACVAADPDVIPGGFDEPEDIVVQPSNGKIIVVGTSVAGQDLYAGSIVRFNADGTLDTTFSDDGIAYLASTSYVKLHAATMSHDARLLVCGERLFGGSSDTDFFVAKLLTSTGELDGSFMGSGEYSFTFDLSANPAEHNDACNDIAVAPDNSIYLAGYAQDGANTYDGAVARLTANGSLMAAFSGDGRRNIASGESYVITDIEIQSDGRSVMLGTRTPPGGGATDLHLNRLSTGGNLQADFGDLGHRTIDFTLPGEYEFAGGLVLQNDRAVAAGSGWTNAMGNEDFVVARLTGDVIFANSFID